MRKLQLVLFGLGGFLLVGGLVAAIWAPGAAERTPTDVNSTTLLSGQAKKLNPATGEIESFNVKATSVTKTDSNKSDGKVVAFTSTSCLLIDRDNPPKCVDGSDERLITASTDVFAANRHTGLAVNSDKYLPASATPHSGLVNKWPFGAKKKTYQAWDGTVGRAVDAKYLRTEKVDGLTVYVYRVTINKAPIDIAEGVPGTYDDVRDTYVEPRTGAIVDQRDNQQRTLSDGTKALDLQLAFTPDQVKRSVADAKSNVAKLNLITRIVPLVGIIGGLLVLVLAFVFGRTSGRDSAHRATSDEPAAATA